MPILSLCMPKICPSIIGAHLELVLLRRRQRGPSATMPADHPPRDISPPPYRSKPCRRAAPTSSRTHSCRPVKWRAVLRVALSTAARGHPPFVLTHGQQRSRGGHEGARHERLLRIRSVHTKQHRGVCLPVFCLDGAEGRAC